jgi:formyltetrahydrofolate hydrolase
MKSTAILLINCPDRKGIVLAVASFLYEHGANILHSDQHQDNELGLFFMRVEWALEDFDLDKTNFQEKFTTDRIHQPLCDRCLGRRSHNRTGCHQDLPSGPIRRLDAEGK